MLNGTLCYVDHSVPHLPRCPWQIFQTFHLSQDYVLNLQSVLLSQLIYPFITSSPQSSETETKSLSSMSTSKFHLRRTVIQTKTRGEFLCTHWFIRLRTFLVYPNAFPGSPGLILLSRVIRLRCRVAQFSLVCPVCEAFCTGKMLTSVF